MSDHNTSNARDKRPIRNSSTENIQQQHSSGQRSQTTNSNGHRTWATKSLPRSELCDERPSTETSEQSSPFSSLRPGNYAPQQQQQQQQPSLHSDKLPSLNFPQLALFLKWLKQQQQQQHDPVQIPEQAAKSWNILRESRAAPRFAHLYSLFHTAIELHNPRGANELARLLDRVVQDDEVDNLGNWTGRKVGPRGPGQRPPTNPPATPASGPISSAQDPFGPPTPPRGRTMSGAVARAPFFTDTSGNPILCLASSPQHPPSLVNALLPFNISVNGHPQKRRRSILSLLQTGPTQDSFLTVNHPDQAPTHDQLLMPPPPRPPPIWLTPREIRDPSLRPGETASRALLRSTRTAQKWLFYEQLQQVANQDHQGPEAQQFMQRTERAVPMEAIQDWTGKVQHLLNHLTAAMDSDNFPAAEELAVRMGWAVSENEVDDYGHRIQSNPSGVGEGNAR